VRIPAQLISSAVLSNQGRHFFLLKRLPEDDLEPFFAEGVILPLFDVC